MVYHEEPNERQPLLLRDALEDPIDSERHESIIPKAHSPNVIIAIAITIVFILEFASMLMKIPSLRIYEDIICHRYYEHLSGVGHIGLNGKIDEGMCKGDEVQNELNLILGVEQFVIAIPGLLVVIPYGLLADRIGRKPIFLLILVGYILSGLWTLNVMWFWEKLPLRLVWLSPVFQLIGGGDAVARVVFYAIATDVTTEQTRSNVFLITMCAGQVASIIAPAMAAISMTHSPWIPVIVGYTILVFGSCLIFFVPETLHLHSGGAVLVADDFNREASPDGRVPLAKTLQSHINGGLQKLRESASIMTLPIVILLLTFLTQPFSIQASEVFPRYISKRFSWTLARTGYLVSLRSAWSIAVLIAVIPSISHVLITRYNYTSKAKDLLLARASIFFLFLGTLCIAASPTISLTVIGLIIYTFGAGFIALCRAVITTLVDKEHVARLYAAIALVETVGTLAASPTLAGLYSLGMKLKGPFIGLPFFFLAFILFLAGLGMWAFGILAAGKSNVERESQSQTDTAVDTDDEDELQYTV
ncbi:major facilitator superfamily transporter [Phlyctema vagabunda]|uniref:Major facilitator superfamily transporter n=1 Tax=Phlyctema vagabunda TaxID=108571 RepID=A0ABR4PMH5_9HELO